MGGGKREQKRERAQTKTKQLVHGQVPRTALTLSPCQEHVNCIVTHLTTRLLTTNGGGSSGYY